MTSNTQQFTPPEELAKELRKGKMIILVDDEDRENEGDIILAADWVTPEAINFMATHGRGLICLALSADRCQKLQLPMMVNNNSSLTGTNFTVSIEARTGVTTGISAQDRATTIAAAIAQYARPEDLVQPGHIFPLRAQDGGVLVRAGHTEAACDLTGMAGFEPAAVIVEILNADGTMARRPQLEKFAQEHQLAIGTIADIIEYRLQTETGVSRGSTMPCPEPWARFTLYSYNDHIHQRTHIALVQGDIAHSNNTPAIRVHQSKGIADTFSLRPQQSTGWSLYDALSFVDQAESGAVILLNFAHQQDDLLDCYFDESAVQEQEIYSEKTSRDYVGHGIGAQILRDLGVHKMQLLSSPSIHFRSLSGFGLEVEKFIPPNQSRA